jgi:hypothetical protein
MSQAPAPAPPGTTRRAAVAQHPGRSSTPIQSSASRRCTSAHKRVGPAGAQRPADDHSRTPTPRRPARALPSRVGAGRRRGVGGEGEDHPAERRPMHERQTGRRSQQHQRGEYNGLGSPARCCRYRGELEEAIHDQKRMARAPDAAATGRAWTARPARDRRPASGTSTSAASGRPRRRRRGRLATASRIRMAAVEMTRTPGQDREGKIDRSGCRLRWCGDSYGPPISRSPIAAPGVVPRPRVPAGEHSMPSSRSSWPGRSASRGWRALGRLLLVDRAPPLRKRADIFRVLQDHFDSFAHPPSAGWAITVCLRALLPAVCVGRGVASARWTSRTSGRTGRPRAGARQLADANPSAVVLAGRS